jgi:orotate phosphoribosyltransferase
VSGPVAGSAPGPRPREQPAAPPEPLDAAAVLALYRRTGGLRHGHFVLSSGRHSDTYLQSAVVLQWPALAAALGRALAAPFSGRVDVVVGPAMGGVVIGHETAGALGVRMVFTERVDGRMALRRSFAVAAGERALVVENVVTTGGSALEVVGLLRAAGAEVAGLATIVDRLPEGATLPLELHALARVAAASWDPADCPACASGTGPEAPGSRRGLPSTRR